MRILWVHNFPPDNTGSGVFMHTLFDAMKRLAVDVSLHYTGYLWGPIRILRAARQLRSDAGEYDLVHAQFGSSAGFVTSFVPKKKVLTLRGSDLAGYEGGHLGYRMHSLACRWMTRRALGSYSRVIVMSNRMKQQVECLRGCPPVDTLPSGIDLNKFTPTDRAEARRRLGEEGNAAPWILFSSVTRVNPIKRMPLASAAVELVRARLPDVELKFLTGQSPDTVPLWVNASNAVLLTSTHEGWPNIIKEALACNVPFVSTDVSDLKELVADEPTCAVADATPEALAEELLAVLGRQRPTTLRRHVECMDADVIARRLVRLYEDVLSSSGQ